jgi:hypothetical protein
MISLAPEGSHLALVSPSGPICTWDLASEPPSWIAPLDTNEGRTIRWMEAINTGGSWLALGFSTSHNHGYLVDLFDGHMVIKLEVSYASAVARATCHLYDQGDYLVGLLLDTRSQMVSGCSIRLEYWSKTGQSRTILNVQVDTPFNLWQTSIKVSPDGTRVAASLGYCNPWTISLGEHQHDRTVIYDVGNPTCPTDCRDSGSSDFISWSPDGTVLAIRRRSGVAFHDTRSGDLLTVSPMVRENSGLFSPDGAYYISLDAYGTKIDDYTSLFSTPKPGNVRPQTDMTMITGFSQDGKLAAVNHPFLGHSHYVVYNTFTLSEENTESWLRSDAFRVDQVGNTLETQGFDIPRTRNPEIGSFAKIFDGLEAPVQVYDEVEAARSSYHHGGTLMAVSFDFKTQLVYVHSLRHGGKSFRLFHTGNPGYVTLETDANSNWHDSKWAFSSDGHLLAGYDKSVGLWCTKTGRNLCRKSISTTSMYDLWFWVSFSHDGGTLFSKRANFTVQRTLSAGSEIFSLSTKRQLSLIDNWVVWEDERLLWFPPEYRERAVIGRTEPRVYLIGLVHWEKNQLSFLHFDPDKL